MKRRDLLAGAFGTGALLATAALPERAAGQASTYEAIAQEVWRPIDPSGGARELVRAATLAANSHNTQPWRFHLTDGAISIAPDVSRRCPAVDPDDHHLFASLGCASENLIHAATVMGQAATPSFESAGDGRLKILLEASRVAASKLAPAIHLRQCSRTVYDGQPLPSEQLRRLEAAGAIEGVDCLMITDKARIENILDYVVQGNTAQMHDKAFMAELTNWLRFNDSEAVKKRDGLFSRASGGPALPSWLARSLLPFVFTQVGEADKYARQIRSSAGIAVFCSAAKDKPHWVLAGQACQRFALEATVLGLKYAFINQPVEVAALRGQFASFLGIGDRRPDLVVRFGTGPGLPRSLRRPLDAVISS